MDVRPVHALRQQYPGAYSNGEAPAVSKRTIVIEGDRVVSVGSHPHIIEEDDRVVDLNGRTVMPGMATCHYHLTSPSGMHEGFAPYGYEYPPGYQALIAQRNLLTTLQQGYTLVVGAGAACDIDPAISQAIDDGFVQGPRFTPSLRELSTTGHANDLLAPWYWRLRTLGAARNCDGPDAFTLAVREEAKIGLKVIKLFVTRGHLVPCGNAIMMSIELGIDIIDHCDEMDDDVIAALAETGTFVVPSVHYPKVVAELTEAEAPEAAAEMKRGPAVHVRRLAEGGGRWRPPSPR